MNEEQCKIMISNQEILIRLIKTMREEFMVIMRKNEEQPQKELVVETEFMEKYASENKILTPDGIAKAIQEKKTFVKGGLGLICQINQLIERKGKSPLKAKIVFGEKCFQLINWNPDHDKHFLVGNVITIKNIYIPSDPVEKQYQKNCFTKILGEEYNLVIMKTATVEIVKK